MRDSRSVRRNVLYAMVAQAISWALTLVVMVYLPRYVGASGLGQLAFAGSLAAILGVAIPLGTSTVLVKEIARSPDRTAELLSAAVAVRIPLGLLATATAGAASWTLHYPVTTRQLVIIACAAMVVGNLNDAVASTLQGQERIARQSAAAVLEKFVYSSLILALIFVHAALWQIAMASVVGAFSSLAANTMAFRTLLPLLRFPSVRVLRYLVSAGLPFMGWSVFSALYGQTDPIIIRLISNDGAVGWYAAACRLVGTTLFLPTAISAALLPTFSRLHSEDYDAFCRLARRSLAMVILLSVPVACIPIFMPGRLIRLLHYGNQFAGSVPVLRIGGIGVILYYSASMLAKLVVSCDKQGQMLRVSIMATVIGIPACLVGGLISQRFSGNAAVGAIASDVVLEIYLAVCYLKLLPPGLLDREFSHSILRLGLVAAAMVLTMVAGVYNGAELWIYLPATILYVWACVYFRIVDRRELMLMKGLVVRRVRPGS